MTPFLDGSYIGLLLTGLAIGAVLSLVASGLGAWVPSWRGSVGIPLAGIALAGPLFVRIESSALGIWGLAGLGALLIAGFATSRTSGPLVQAAASLPGAAMLAVDVDKVPPILVVVLTAALVIAIAKFEEGHDYEHGLATICAAIAAGGAFLTVPDTEHASLLAGAGTAVALFVFIQPRLALRGSAMVWSGAFVWMVCVDGPARTTGMIGAVGALGLLLIDPAVRAYLPINRGLMTYISAGGPRPHLVSTAAIQTVLAVVTARVAGLQESVTVAVAITLGAWLLVGTALTYRANSLHPTAGGSYV